MRATYHNHSNRSDGQSPISEFVSFAQKHDIDELGISDHLCILPGGETSPISIPLDALDEYVREIDSFKKFARPEIRLGVEVDWFQGQGDVIRNAIEPFPFDYRIGGVHYVQDKEIDRLQAAGYTEIARFKHRKISFEPLIRAQPGPYAAGLFLDGNTENR